jgi:two-component system sensor histidine kinase YesM
MLSKSVNTPYVLTLLYKNDIVRYSSNPNHFSLGQVLQLNEDSEITKKYKWNRLENYYDFNIALLVTAASYNQELYKWKNSMFVVFGATLLIMAVIAALLLQLIYKPLRIFKIEMDALGKGNLNAMPYRTGILEFDQLFEQFNKMKQHIQQLILDVEIKEKRKTELEVEKLSYQINPHFLMNTLDSVHWMAKMREQPEIDKVICTLNYMLSYNLGKTKESTTLRTEISVLRAYLELQQMRYEFQVILDYDEGEFLDYPVARFILQPIAENAICHGLNENGKIEINIRLDESSRNVIIRISDDGTGMSPDMLMRLQDPDLKENQHMGRGIGLRYVRLMLDSYYGRNAHMEIASEPGKGTTVTMYLPVRKETPS